MIAQRRKVKRGETLRVRVIDWLEVTVEVAVRGGAVHAEIPERLLLVPEKEDGGVNSEESQVTGDTVGRTTRRTRCASA